MSSVGTVALNSSVLVLNRNYTAVRVVSTLCRALTRFVSPSSTHTSTDRSPTSSPTTVLSFSIAGPPTDGAPIAHVEHLQS